MDARTGEGAEVYVVAVGLGGGFVGYQKHACTSEKIFEIR